MATKPRRTTRNDRQPKPGRRRAPASRRTRSRKKFSAFEQVVDQLSARVIVADVDLSIVYMNESSRQALHTLESYLPCSVDEMIGQSIDLFHEDPASQREILNDPTRLPHRAQIRLGDEILDLCVVALQDGDGMYAGPMLTWEIVTEESRQQTNADGQIAAINKSQAVIEFEMDGTILTANDNFLSAMGYTLEEIEGRHHSMFVDDETRNERRVPRLLGAFESRRISHRRIPPRRKRRPGRLDSGLVQPDLRSRRPALQGGEVRNRRHRATARSRPRKPGRRTRSTGRRPSSNSRWTVRF